MIGIQQACDRVTDAAEPCDLGPWSEMDAAFRTRFRLASELSKESALDVRMRRSAVLLAGCGGSMLPLRRVKWGQRPRRNRKGQSDQLEMGFVEEIQTLGYDRSGGAVSASLIVERVKGDRLLSFHSTDIVTPLVRKAHEPAKTVRPPVQVAPPEDVATPRYTPKASVLQQRRHRRRKSEP